MFLKMLLIKLYTAVHKIYKQNGIWPIMLVGSFNKRLRRHF